MDHKPLYERYRPQRFEDFVGQADVTRALRAMIQTGRLTGAALIYGPTGSGKTTLARIVSGALRVDRFWDHHEIDAGECKIDTVRELRQDMRFVGKGGGWRLWLVDECHTISKAAREAFLSLIEKVPRKCLIVFCTTDPKPLKES